MILRDESRMVDLVGKIEETYCFLLDSAIGLVPDCDVDRDFFATNRMTRLVRHYQQLESIRERYLASMN